MNTVLFVIAAYLIGSISFAVVVSKLFGIADPRTYGSKNPGATNVLRSGSTAAAVLTLVGDAFKGWLAVWLTDYFGAQYSVFETGVALVAVAVFLGHLWPVFFRFKGGKGVATALGVLLAINGWLALATLATWLIVVYASRYSSLGAIVSAVFAPFYYGLLFGADVKLGAIAVMCALLLFRHGANIGKLMAGTESRLGGSKGAGKDGRTAPKSGKKK